METMNNKVNTLKGLDEPLNNKNSIENEIETIIKNNLNIDIEKLNPFYQKYLNLYDSIRESSKEHIFSALLPAIASAIGSNRFIYQGKKLYPNIWSIGIGASTTARKTTAQNSAISPIRRKEKIDRETLPKEEIKALLLAQVFSNAALYQELENSQNGIIVFSEIKSLFDMAKAKHNANLITFLTSAFDVLPVRKKLNNESYDIEKPIFSLSGVTTLSWLQPEVTNTELESGFLARFLYCHHSPSDKCIPFAERPDQKERDNLENIILNLYSLEEKEILMNDISKEIYTKFYKEVREYLLQLENENSRLCPFIGRLQVDYFFKFLILECVLNGIIIAGATETNNALYLVKYFMAQIKFVLGEFLPETVKIEKKILDFIKKKGKPSKSEITKLVNNLGLKASDGNQILKELVESEQIQKIEKSSSNSKKPVTFYIIGS